MRPASLLSLYASGKSSGIVLDGGGGKTTATAIYEGKLIKTLFVPCGGEDMTRYMKRKMESACGFSEADSYTLAEEIKKTNASNAKYELPDGRLFETSKLPKELRSPSSFCFQPSKVVGFKEKVSWEIMRLLHIGALKDRDSVFYNAPKDVMNMLYSHLCIPYSGYSDLIREVEQAAIEKTGSTDAFKDIVVTGGSTLCNDVMDRLKFDFGERICDIEDRGYLAWRGGEIIQKKFYFILLIL